MMKKHLFIVMSIAIAVNLCLTLYLINETVMLKDKAPITAVITNDEHCPAADIGNPINRISAFETSTSPQIIIEYLNPFYGTQKFTVTIDDRINTGNAFVDNELTEYLQFCKKLINDSNKPKFYVTETSEKIYILAVWPEFYEELEYDESDFTNSQTVYQYLHCNLVISSV